MIVSMRRLCVFCTSCLLCSWSRPTDEPPPEPPAPARQIEYAVGTLTAPCLPCDVDRDGVVSGDDAWIVYWHRESTNAPECDVNADGYVDQADMDLIDLHEGELVGDSVYVTNPSALLVNWHRDLPPGYQVYWRRVWVPLNWDVVPFKPWVVGDFNFSGDVDQFDLAIFEWCASGPGVPYTLEYERRICGVPDGRTYPISCSLADFDRDGDVDQEDFGFVQARIAE